MTITDPPGHRDRAWFEALFRAHHAAILAYARRRTASDADDVVAEVFTVAWRRRDSVPDDPLPWLYRTAAHQVLHAHRGAARRGGLLRRLSGTADPVAGPDPTGDDAASRADGSAAVRDVLARLPTLDAEVLRLWAWEGLDAAAIGYVLDCTATTARVRLSRARRRAQALLAVAPVPGAWPAVPSLPPLPSTRQETLG